MMGCWGYKHIRHQHVKNRTVGLLLSVETSFLAILSPRLGNYSVVILLEIIRAATPNKAGPCAHALEVGLFHHCIVVVVVVVEI
jgi:hypothetical protein